MAIKYCQQALYQSKQIQLKNNLFVFHVVIKVAIKVVIKVVIKNENMAGTLNDNTGIKTPGNINPPRFLHHCAYEVY